MPDAKSKARVLNYQTHIIAINLLRAKKSAVVIRAAYWQNTYNAELELARNLRKIDQIDRAKRDIIIVAVTGMAICIGAAVVTGVLAKSAGVSYVSFSMAAPVVTTTTALTLPTGATIITTSNRALAASFKQFLVGQFFKSVINGLPVGLLLKKFVGNNALSRLAELVANKISETPYSENEFSE